MGEKGKNVLVAASHTGATNSLVPVIKQLRRENKINILVVGHGPAVKVFRDNAIAFSEIDEQHISLDYAKLILETANPDLVLVGTSAKEKEDEDVIEQALTIAAREKRIPSLALVDFWGSYGPNSLVRFGDRFTGESFKYVPDKIAVIDEINLQEYKDEGFDPGILVVTGNPYFDNLPRKTEELTDEYVWRVRHKIGCLDDELLLFFAGSVFLRERDRFGFWDLDVLFEILKVLDQVSGFEKVRLVVKLHPGAPDDDKNTLRHFLDNRNQMRAFLEREKDIALVQDIDTRSLILASHLTIISVTTVGLEAVYAGRPCMSFQPGLATKDNFILTARGVIPCGYSSKECQDLLREFILHPIVYELKMLQQAQGFRTDGKAIERVINLIYQMLSS